MWENSFDVVGQNRDALAFAILIMERQDLIADGVAFEDEVSAVYKQSLIVWGIRLKYHDFVFKDNINYLNS